MIRRYEVSETERMLAAGFHKLPADTPKRKEDLRSLPPHRIVSRTKDGLVVHTYADPDNCYCVYGGGANEYSEYERLRGKYELEFARRAGGSSPSGGARGGAP